MNTTKERTQNLLFVIGACNIHGIKFAGQVSKKGLAIFDKMLKDGFTPPLEQFVISLQHLIDSGFIYVDDLRDMQNHQEMWTWFQKKLREKK